jgi:ketose-bisphosphate aldolase
MQTAASAADLIRRAWQAGLAVPAFNIPYLPMMEPVVSALRDTDSAGLITVARLEWTKFRAGGPRQVAGEYRRVGDPNHTRLHLDHIPVVDEDGRRVDYLGIIAEALEMGYESVMVDGSRLPLEENVAASRRVAEMAHSAGAAVEAELGAVLGHEPGPPPSYEELFASRRGFTDPGEARRFVADTGVDWLSVAIGNVHGAISAARRRTPKIRARLDVEHLAAIREAADLPLVLHGGTGVSPDLIRRSVAAGIVKINVATAIRQPYEALVQSSAEEAREAVYSTVVTLVRDDLGAEGSARLIAERSRM